MCRCDCRCVGCTSQTPKSRIKCHVSKTIALHLWKERHVLLQRCRITFLTDCDLAIGQPLLENQDFAAAYNDNQFTVLATAISSSHLAIFEAPFTNDKQAAPCRQKVLNNALLSIQYRLDYGRRRNETISIVSPTMDSDTFFFLLHSGVYFGCEPHRNV